MAVNGICFKLYSMIGAHRNLLSSRIILPIYQPVALKRTIEERIGLPLKPKKPPTPYLQFSSSLRPVMIQKHPTLRISEITKLLAQEWHKADEKLKKELQKTYDTQIELYQSAKTEYAESLTTEQKKKLETIKIMLKNSKAREVQKKRLKSLGKPKRPAAAFAMWSKTLGARRGSIKLSEWQKAMVPKWEALPAIEKEGFELKAAEAMNLYKIELRNWKSNMIKAGYHDLISYGRQVDQPVSEKKERSE